MCNERPLTIVFYDSLGSGGACHYTHELAEALTRFGCRSILLTNAGYELDGPVTQFKNVTLRGIIEQNKM